MTMKNTADTTYITKDFYLAAFLLTNGLEIVNLDRTDPRRVYFVFHDVEARTSLVEDFLFGRAKVEPKQYAGTIKEIKQLLYSND